MSKIQNNHDPFCRSYYPSLTEVSHCTWCQVIALVRLEERGYNMSTETGARGYGNMIHDPLCRQRYQPYEKDDDCHDCKLIAAAYQRGYEDATQDLLDDDLR